MDECVPDVVARITKYAPPSSIKKGYYTSLSLVTLKPGKTLGNIADIKCLLKQAIVWENTTRKEYKCQRWGHVSKNCGSQYNCVKCYKKHPPGECQKKKKIHLAHSALTAMSSDTLPIGEDVLRIRFTSQIGKKALGR